MFVLCALLAVLFAGQFVLAIYKSDIPISILFATEIILFALLMKGMI